MLLSEIFTILENDSLIGPHEWKELPLMLAGKKKIALIDSYKLQNFLPYIKKNLFKVLKFESFQVPSYIVYDPDHEDKAKELKDIYVSAMGRGMLLTLADHKRIGQILGYSDEAIDFFINRMRQKGIK